ncbi:MAG TPA: type II secretion system major pseudopilin GspG [Usitatibacter sp.]|jgi:general secretion pathway protein G|nr:type II secretion system major pseudopilin GspG [Usitatibacter sp.]
MKRSSRIRTLAQRGFTILEILIVFILIATLMAFVLPKIFSQSQKANWQQAQLKLRTLAGEIEMYKLEVGRYPENLQALAKQPAGADRWNGPYAKEDELKDAWGNDYRYQVPGTNKPYDLISLGADGREGGEGENKDITN